MKKTLTILLALGLIGLSAVPVAKKKEVKCGNEYLMQYAPQVCYQNIKNYSNKPVEQINKPTLNKNYTHKHHKTTDIDLDIDF